MKKPQKQLKVSVILQFTVNHQRGATQVEIKHPPLLIQWQEQSCVSNPCTVFKTALTLSHEPTVRTSLNSSLFKVIGKWLWVTSWVLNFLDLLTCMGLSPCIEQFEVIKKNNLFLSAHMIADDYGFSSFPRRYTWTQVPIMYLMCIHVSMLNSITAQDLFMQTCLHTTDE